MKISNLEKFEITTNLEEEEDSQSVSINGIQITQEAKLRSRLKD